MSAASSSRASSPTSSAPRRPSPSTSELEGQRSGVQISFFILFAVVALLLLLAAVWVGLLFANKLIGPIGGLISAAERVGARRPHGARRRRSTPTTRSAA